MLLSNFCGCLEYDHHGYYQFYLPTIIGVLLFLVLQSVFGAVSSKRSPDGEIRYTPERHKFAVSFPLIAAVLWFVSLFLSTACDSFLFLYLFFLPAFTVVGTLEYMGASETGVDIAFVVGPIAQYVGYGIVIDRIRSTRNPRSRACWLSGAALVVLACALWFTIEPYPPEPDTSPGALGLPVVFAIHGLLVAVLLWRAAIWWRLALRSKNMRSPTSSVGEDLDEGNGGDAA